MGKRWGTRLGRVHSSLGHWRGRSEGCPGAAPSPRRGFVPTWALGARHLVGAISARKPMQRALGTLRIGFLPQSAHAKFVPKQSEKATHDGRNPAMLPPRMQLWPAGLVHVDLVLQRVAEPGGAHAQRPAVASRDTVRSRRPPVARRAPRRRAPRATLRLVCRHAACDMRLARSRARRAARALQCAVARGASVREASDQPRKGASKASKAQHATEQIT